MTDVELLSKVVNDNVNKTAENFIIKKVKNEPCYKITNKLNGKKAVVPIYAVNEVVDALEKLF